MQAGNDEVLLQQCSINTIKYVSVVLLLYMSHYI